MNLTYDAGRYTVRSLQEAAAIILTAEGASTEDRWQRETPYIIDLFMRNCGPLSGDSVVLDFGCGVGRLSKEIIARVGCHVVGVDVSPSMLSLAQLYVSDPRFITCSPFALLRLGIRFDAALAVWVLQHCLYLQEDLGLIKAILNLGSPLLVVNNVRRAVPTREVAWADDDVDVVNTLNTTFQRATPLEIDPGFVAPGLRDGTFWGVWHRDF